MHSSVTEEHFKFIVHEGIMSNSSGVEVGRKERKVFLAFWIVRVRFSSIKEKLAVWEIDIGNS